jgi:hypothetical protein
MTTRTSLYRHYNATGELLYVGISLSAINRLYEHKNSVWFADITKVDIEQFETRMLAIDAETIAIRNEKPLFNINKGTDNVVLHLFYKDNNDFYKLIKAKTGKYKCSYYSPWLYELLTRYKKRKQLTVEVDKLRQALQLGDKYPRTSDIKKKIVLPAIKDIQESSDLNVSYEQVKYGKEIVKFVFKYAPKKTEQPKITKAYIENHARPGESYETAGIRLRKMMAQTK